MKTKICFTALFLLLVFLSSFSLASCSSRLSVQEENVKTEESTKKEIDSETEKEEKKEMEKIALAPLATEEDKAHLEGLYAGRTAFYGDIHCHPLAGVMPDGRKTLAQWKEKMKEIGIDFVAFMNHRQIAHMYEEEWDDTLFIGGTEPATSIKDSSAQDKSLHFNMFFREPTDLYDLLMEFPEFKYTGGQDGIPKMEGSFSYVGFDTEHFKELIAAVKAKGGFFVNVHPKQQMQSFRAEDYYFADQTGLEVFYGYKGNIVGQDTKDNYKLWTKLLSMGKRIWATAGSDSHGDATTAALTCIYSEKQKDTSYLSYLREGDFVCGFAGIRMTVGDAKMGSSTDFNGKRVVISVDAVHPTMCQEGREYTILIYDGKGEVYSAAYDGKTNVTFAFDADENTDFYRVEVRDEKKTAQPIIAIGNPIWND